MILGVNIIGGKASETSNMRALQAPTEWTAPSPKGRGVRRRSSLNFLGSKEHLDWLKIDLNKAKIITVQNYKRTKN